MTSPELPVFPAGENELSLIGVDGKEDIRHDWDPICHKRTSNLVSLLQPT